MISVCESGVSTAREKEEKEAYHGQDRSSSDALHGPTADQHGHTLGSTNESGTECEKSERAEHDGTATENGGESTG